LKKIQSIAKSQTKAQKKIDKFMKKRSNVDEELNGMTPSSEVSEADRTAVEAKRLKLQEKVVKLQGKLDKYAY